MKHMSLLLCCSILCSGCFAESSLTRDESAPANSKVFFYLKDGSYIRSFSDHHHKVDGGYLVSGTLVKSGDNRENFEGLVPDDQIVEFGVDEFSVVGTLVGLGVATVMVVGIISSFHMGSFSSFGISGSLFGL
jgi:hypothetical protein